MRIITIYYKGGYSGSIQVLQILIWAAVAMYLTMALGNTMISANMQKLQMKLVMLLAVREHHPELHLRFPTSIIPALPW